MYRPVSILVLKRSRSTNDNNSLLVLAVGTLVLSECFDKQLEDLHVCIQLLVSLCYEFLFDVLQVLLHQGKSLLLLLNLLFLSLNLIFECSGIPKLLGCFPIQIFTLGFLDARPYFLFTFFDLAFDIIVIVTLYDELGRLGSELFEIEWFSLSFLCLYLLLSLRDDFLCKYIE